MDETLAKCDDFTSFRIDWNQYPKILTAYQSIAALHLPKSDLNLENDMDLFSSQYSLTPIPSQVVRELDNFCNQSQSSEDDDDLDSDLFDDLIYEEEISKNTGVIPNRPISHYFSQLSSQKSADSTPAKPIIPQFDGIGDYVAKSPKQDDIRNSISMWKRQRKLEKTKNSEISILDCEWPVLFSQSIANIWSPTKVPILDAFQMPKATSPTMTEITYDSVSEISDSQKSYDAVNDPCLCSLQEKKDIDSPEIIRKVHTAIATIADVKEMQNLEVLIDQAGEEIFNGPNIKQQLTARKIRVFKSSSTRLFNYAIIPPTLECLRTSIPRANVITNKNESSQLPVNTQGNTFGFKFSQGESEFEVDNDGLTYMCVDVHVHTRDSKVPNPEFDPIRAVFYHLKLHTGNSTVGVISSSDSIDSNRIGISGFRSEVVADEKAILQSLIQLVSTHNPDFIIGYEIQSSSWGYLYERAQFLGVDFENSVSRLVQTKSEFNTRQSDIWGQKKQSAIHCTGRIVLNVWRLMKSQLTLTSYSIENTVFHVLHQRIPKFSFQNLTQWYDSGLTRWKTWDYYLKRVQYPYNLLLETELISQTAASAKVYGIDFYSVLLRGSQYRVEAVLSRISRPENFLCFTPSRKQVSQMRAVESIPLNMEPDSKYYTNAVCVMDFQSLYPSITIAYNYCYSTCLGHVDKLCKKNTLGVLPDYSVSRTLLREMRQANELCISPNGFVFVKPSVRKGVVGRMLREILETRVMVKTAMKMYKNDKRLFRILDAKQKSLKLLANVTCGYTSASFSGRMPCAEVSDSIIQTGRTTLEHSISFANHSLDYKAHVVYGDTDSLFIELKDCNREAAFRYGTELVNNITRLNPQPIKLNFEKVYHPCVLIAKKRYVGFKYEYLNDQAVFDAKGIETVRRDGCPIVGKTLEAALKILFRTNDILSVKQYLIGQWRRLLNGQINLQDLIVAKEVKLGTYSSNQSATLPAGALLATKNIAKDSRNAPEHGERVPVVFVNRDPNSLLIDCAVSPLQVSSENLIINSTYYIEKQINPALNRVFQLLGYDIMSWYNKMPKFNLAKISTSKKKNTVDCYYISTNCLVCRSVCEDKICKPCLADSQRTFSTLETRSKNSEARLDILKNLCRTCTGHSKLDIESLSCVSMDCSALFTRKRYDDKAVMFRQFRDALDEMHQNIDECRNWFDF